MRGMKGFRNEPHRRAQGRRGEEEAVRWLQGQGYQILERNVATRAGEIDVVALDGDTLCFIEIKARGSGAFGPAIAAVTPAKQRRLARAAALYLVRRGTDIPPCRFDVLGLDPDRGGWKFTLVRNAFEVRGF